MVECGHGHVMGGDNRQAMSSCYHDGGAAAGDYCRSGERLVRGACFARLGYQQKSPLQSISCVLVVCEADYSSL